MRDVMERLAISRAYAYELVTTGQLPCVRLGRALRVKESDLIAFIEHLRAAGAGGNGVAA